MKTKKIISFVLVTIIILMIFSPVKAATSYVVELISNATTAKQGQQIEITIKVKDIVDIAGGIAGLSAKLEYDTSKLERIGEGQALNGFMLVEGDTIELAKYPGVTKETEIAKFTFKVKENATGEAKISLKQIEAANGTDTIPLGKNVSKTIQIKSSTPGKLSSNNYLSSLKVDGKLIANFKKDTLTYTLANVKNSKTSIKITAEAEDTKATITGTGNKNLNVGENSFQIVVTAEDGTTKTYEIKVRREAVNTNNEKNNINDKNSGSKNNSTNTSTDITEKEEEDKTKSPTTVLPQTGVGMVIICTLVIMIIIAIINFIKAKKLSGIK